VFICLAYSGISSFLLYSTSGVLCTINKQPMNSDAQLAARDL